MADRAQHLKQWEHNRGFLAGIIQQPDYADWVTTAAFYTALHAVQVLILSDKNPRAVSHETRNLILRDDPRYSKLWPNYKALYDAAMVARYDCSGWLPINDVKNELIKRRLFQIEKSVVRLSKLHVSPSDLFAQPYDAAFKRVSP